MHQFRLITGSNYTTVVGDADSGKEDAHVGVGLNRNSELYSQACYEIESVIIKKSLNIKNGK